MAAYTLLTVDPTQITLATTVTDTVTMPAAKDAVGSARSVVVWNLSGATSLRVTVDVVGFALDPAGITATIIPAGKAAMIAAPAGLFAALDVKVVGSANVYSVARTELAVIPAAPSALPSTFETLRGLASYDTPSLLTNSGTTTTVSVLGAVVGDYVEVASNITIQGMTLSGFVSAAGVVTVVTFNSTAGTLDLAAATITVRLRK